MPLMKLRGSYTALITPFTRRGSLDKKALEKLVDWQIAEGTDGLVCSATTGEGCSLSDAERKAIAEICIKAAAGRVPIVVATGTNDTRQSVRYTETALKLGASGCLAVTPYYNRPTQRGCVAHYKELGRVGLPIIVYLNPTRTGFRFLPETVKEIGQLPNVIALKDSNHDIEFVKKVKSYIPLVSGDDDFTFEEMKEGAIGSIGVIANFIPKAWKQMMELCLQSKWKEAKEKFDRYMPLCKAVFLESNPQGIKYCISLLKRCEPIWRLPLLGPSESMQQEIRKEILKLALPQYKSGIKSL